MIVTNMIVVVLAFIVAYLSHENLVLDMKIYKLQTKLETLEHVVNNVIDNYIINKFEEREEHD